MGRIKCDGTIPSVMSGLTLSLKLFLCSRTSFGSVPLTWPYWPRVWPPRHDNGPLNHGYDMWRNYLILIPVPHIFDLCIACLVRVYKYSFFFFAIQKMVGPILEFIFWLIFSKYSFQKTVFYFLDLE